MPDMTIHEAAWTGNTQAVEALLNGGIGVNAQAQGGMTPLHFAVKYCRTEVATLPLDRGADVNARDKTPLHCAAQRGRTPLHSASTGAHTETADFLRSRGGEE